MAFSANNLEQRIQLLEQKVKSLEAALNSNKQTSGLKVKDYKKSQAQRLISSTTNSEGPSMTPEQQKEIMKQLEVMKERQEDSQKMLDQIMNDEF